MDHKIKRARGWVAKAIAVIAVTVGVSLLGPPWILDSGKAFLASLDNPIALHGTPRRARALQERSALFLVRLPGTHQR